MDSGHERYKDLVETEQNPVGSSSAPKSFCVPISKGRFKQLLIRGVRECRNKGKAVKKQ